MIEIKHKVSGEVLHVLSGDKLAAAKLERACLVAANLGKGQLAESDLRGANLAVADLQGADLTAANLAAANLTGANLQGADLGRADLQQANLTGATLRSARLEGANLQGADLQGADLTAANLAGANLRGANLAYACLEGVVLTGAQYDNATDYTNPAANLAERGATYISGQAAGRDQPVERYLSSHDLPALAEPSFRHLEVRTEESVLVLTFKTPQVEGEEVAEEVRQELVAAVTLSGLNKVVVNLQSVQYVSSVAFRPLLNLRRKLREIDGRLVLCGLSKVIGDVFYTTRLVSRTGEVSAPFEMEPDVPAAIAHLNRATAPPS